MVLDCLGFDGGFVGWLVCGLVLLGLFLVPFSAVCYFCVSSIWF